MTIEKRPERSDFSKGRLTGTARHGKREQAATKNRLLNFPDRFQVVRRPAQVKHLLEIRFTELLEILPAGFLPVRIEHLRQIPNVAPGSRLRSVSCSFRLLAFLVCSANFHFRRIVFQVHQIGNVFDEIYTATIVGSRDLEANPTELPVDSLLFHNESESCRVDQTGNLNRSHLLNVNPCWHLVPSPLPARQRNHRG